MLAVFDLDGCLMDTLAPTTQALNQIRAHFGRSNLSTSDVRGCMGGSSQQLVNKALNINITSSQSLMQADEAVMELYLSRFTELAIHSELYRGIAEVLQLLEDLDVNKAILSNRAEPLVYKLVEVGGLDHHFAPDTVVGHSGKWPTKPNPGALTYLMSSQKATPEQTIMIGDSDVDSQVAHAANCSHIGCYYGYGTPQNISRFYRADSAQELSSILLEWYNSR